MNTLLWIFFLIIPLLTVCVSDSIIGKRFNACVTPDILQSATRANFSVNLSCPPNGRIAVISGSFGLASSECRIRNPKECAIDIYRNLPELRKCNGLSECSITLYINVTTICEVPSAVEIFYDCLGNQPIRGRGFFTPSPTVVSVSSTTLALGKTENITTAEDMTLDNSYSNNRGVHTYLAVVGALCGITAILILVVISFMIYINRLKQRLSVFEKTTTLEEQPDDYAELEDIPPPPVSANGDYITAVDVQPR